MRCNELGLVQDNHATVRLDSNGFSWNENRIELRDPQILKNAGKIKAVFLIRAALSSLDIAFNTAGIERIRSENQLRLRSTLEATRFEFE